jgi:hypothetical protein
MTNFKTDLFKKTSLKIEHTAIVLSETELDAVSGGGMNKPPVLPPRGGPTDPRQW